MQTFQLGATSVIASLIVICGVASAFAIPLTPFRYELQAQRHCPADVIVWLDLGKGIYYSKRVYWEFRLPGGGPHQRLSPVAAWVAITRPSRVSSEAGARIRVAAMSDGSLVERPSRRS
jgi:hypothetical protein